MRVAGASAPAAICGKNAFLQHKCCRRLSRCARLGGTHECRTSRLVTPAEALAEFLAPLPSRDGSPAPVVFEGPIPITDAMGRREAAFWILVDRRSAEFGREIYVEDGEMCEVREILDGIPDETVLAVS